MVGRTSQFASTSCRKFHAISPRECSVLDTFVIKSHFPSLQRLLGQQCCRGYGSHPVTPRGKTPPWENTQTCVVAPSSWLGPMILQKCLKGRITQVYQDQMGFTKTGASGPDWGRSVIRVVVAQSIQFVPDSVPDAAFHVSWCNSD